MTTLFRTLAAGALLSMSMASASLADGHGGWEPNGPIKLIIAFRAGGGADTSGRLIAEGIQDAKGWEIIPEQITGKGGVNALVALRDMPNDGSAIALVVTESLGYNAASARDAGVEPSQFTGLTTTAGFQMGIVAKTEMGWNDIGDAINAVKAGEELRFGAMSPKLADLAFLLGDANGIEFNIIEVTGGRAVMDGVVAGDMDLGFMAGIQAGGVASGELVNLASALSVPLKQSPEAPTMADYGLDYNADGYFVLVAPAGLPDDARMALTEAIVEASNSGKAAEMISAAFGGTVNITGEKLDALLQNDFDAAGALIEAAQ